MRLRMTIGNLRGEKGFTLIEMLVSGILFLLTITAIVAMMRKSREMDINDLYRRTARRLIVAQLENPQLKYDQYINISNRTGTNDSTVVLHDRNTPGNTTDDIKGKLTLEIGAPDTETVGGSNVPFVLINVKIVWNTIDGPDSVSAEKKVCRVAQP